MGWDGSGNYNRQRNFSADASAGIKILASAMDQELNDVASAITVAWARDGQNTPTADIPLGGYRIVNGGQPASATDYIRAKEVIENTPIYMVDTATSADRISVSAQFFTNVSAGQAPADGTKIMVRMLSNKASAAMHLDGHSANINYRFGGVPGAAFASGGIYEFVYSSADTAWQPLVTEREFDINNYGAHPSATAAANTTAIQNAINAASAIGGTITASVAGTYLVTPATDITLVSSEKTCFTLASNTHFYLPGVTFKISDNVSTDAAVVVFNMFATNSAISNVSFRGLTFDMNGANNDISPSRPTTYSQNNYAMIVAGGDNGRIDDFHIENCILQNTPGVCCIALGFTNTASVTLGNGARIVNNIFRNNGLDTNDHTSVFAWCDNVYGSGNTFEADNPWGTTGKTGGATGWEIHGSDQRWEGNTVQNYYRGCYIAMNYSTDVYRAIVHANTFNVQYRGVELFTNSTASGLSQIKSAIISENQFNFDDTDPASLAQTKGAIYSDDQYAFGSITIENNKVEKTGTTLPCMLSIIVATNIAGQDHEKIVIRGNEAIGCTIGSYFKSVTNAGFKYIEHIGNRYFDFDGASVTFTTAIGLYVDATGAGIDTLVIGLDKFIDQQGSPTFEHGVILTAGTISNLIRDGLNTYQNLTTANYSETGGITITNRSGFWDDYAETATGTFTLSSIIPSTNIDSSGGAVTGTLGSGPFVGFVKTIVMTDATTSSTVSVTNHETSDPEVITFDAVDETAVLMWTGTEWITIVLSGATV